MTFEHSSESNEHYSPPVIVNAARATMGRIDLDPASCEEANEVVQATDFFTIESDGLSLVWRYIPKSLEPGYPSKVFLNPPGGKVGKRSSSVVWWEKLCSELEKDNIEQAIFICFNLEVLNTTQASPVPCLDFPICYFRKRPRFWPPGTPPEQRGIYGSPKYPGCCVYLPPKNMEASLLGKRRFVDAFESLGRVVIPA